MKVNSRSKLSAAKATGGIVGVTLGGLAVVAGIGVMVAAPFVGGIAVGMAVAGAVHGAVGVISGVVAGFAAAGVSGAIGMYAGMGVMAVGIGVATAIGAAVNGTLKLAGLGIKGVALGVKKLFSLGRKKKPAAATAATAAPAQDAAGAFKAGSSKVPFDNAVKRAPQNDNAVVNTPRQKPNAPKL